MFIARQPIFNKKKEVYAYELLFRQQESSAGFDGHSAVAASASVLGGLFEEGIGKITDGKPAFINFDETLIFSDAVELIHPDTLVIELLETIVVTEPLVERVKILRDRGYRIALDDFEESYSAYPLVPMAKIIKYDILHTPLSSLQSDVKKALLEHKILLAEKVETEQVFEEAKAMGFHLFQGYFFSKPNIVGESPDHSSSKSQYSRLLMELKKDEPSYQVLAQIIEQDANLAYRMMKVVSHRSEQELVYSIKKALTYMGLNEIERWVHILMLQDFGKHKPLEVLRTSLIRTKLAEQLARRAGLQQMKFEAAMMGLFSLIDALLDQDMKTALEGISLPESIKETLIKNSGCLQPIYELIVSFERADWEKVESLAAELGIHCDDLQSDYLMALEWASGALEKIN